MTAPRAYLDHNATSPLRPEVREAIVAALAAGGNPSSVHQEGREARAIVEDARETIAGALALAGGDLVFTASGTEACQLAILGTAEAMGIERLIVSAIEHAAVLDAAAASGIPVATLEVTPSGVVDLDHLADLFRASAGEKVLVAVMAANNETGVEQPIAEVARIARAHGAFVFCDAVQAFTKSAIDLGAAGIDLAAVSAHKVGGPQGAGALAIGSGMTVAPVIRGRQERGRRGGTENIAGIAGFAAAVVAAGQEDRQRLAAGRARLEAAVLEITPHAVIVGADAPRLANTSALALPGASAETLVIALDLEGVAVSAGAACSSGKVGSSHVLEAMRLAPEIRRGTIRVSLGWSTGDADIDAFVAAWERVAARLADRTAA